MTLDTISTKTCGRCGGTGRYSFNLMDLDRCYGCGGTGKIPCTPKGQKKIKPTSELASAKVGDVVMHTKVLYRIERIEWIKGIWRGHFFFNQKAIAIRLVDGKRFLLYRSATREDGRSLSTSTKPNGEKTHSFGAQVIDPSPELIGQETDVCHIRMTDEARAEAIAYWGSRGYSAEAFRV